MKLLKLKNLTEEIQDYIADNSGLGYTVAQNFTAENAMDFTSIGRLLGRKILLTMFDEGGTLIPSGKQTYQQRFFRFVAKGTHANEALDRARDLLKWLWDKKTFETATYRIWIQAQSTRLPAVIARGDNGSFLADFVLTTLVFCKV